MVKTGGVLCAALIALGGLSTPAIAGPEAAEIGYKEGALGYAALTGGDYQRAEVQLNRLDGVEKDDPARLINLGQVYAKTGRHEEARRAYISAMKSGKSFDVVLADGRVVSSREAARMALAGLPGNFAAVH